jgi:hypothetical protein
MSILFDMLRGADAGEVLAFIDTKVGDFLAQSVLSDSHSGRIILVIDVDVQRQVVMEEGIGVQVRVKAVELSTKDSLPEEVIPKAAAQKPS